MLKKAFNKIISIVLAAILVFQLTACTKENTVMKKEEDKMKGTLSVYYVDYADQIGDSGYTYGLTLLLQNLQEQHEDLKINATAFPSHDAFMTQVSTEIAAGSGPDLFLLDWATRLNFDKMVLNGSYENLTPYIEKDKDFSIEDYYESVIKAGEIDGNQYLLPLGFFTTSLFTSKSKLLKSESKLEGEYAYKDVLAALDKAVIEAKKNEAEIPLALNLNRNDYLPMFMSAFGMPFVDYQQRIVTIDKSSLMEICDFLKAFEPFSKQAWANKATNSSMTERIRDVQYYISNVEYATTIGYQRTMMEQIGEESISIFMPKYDEPSEITASISHYVVVNSNSKNKQLAYDSSKSIMDMASGRFIAQNWAVNRNTADVWLEDEILGHPWQITIDGNILQFSNTEEHIESLKSAVELVQYVTLDNVDVQGIVNDGMAPYIEGIRSFDECYDETVNKLKLYINE